MPPQEWLPYAQRVVRVMGAAALYVLYLLILYESHATLRILSVTMTFNMWCMGSERCLTMNTGRGKRLASARRSIGLISAPPQAEPPPHVP